MDNTKKILVTGSEGYIGGVLVPMLIEAGYQPTGLDVCFYREGNINNYAFPDYELVEKDVRDVDIADLENKGYFGVVHLAALSNDPLGMLDEKLTYEINHEASVRLAKLAKQAGIRRFVFASSCSLYGSGASMALTEESPSNPQTAYGKSKILAEKDISQLADENFSPTFMRNATAFGFSPRMRFDLVVNNLAGYAKVDHEIKIMGDGKPWRPLVHIRDIAGAMIAVLNSHTDIIHDQAFNVGDNGENYQIKKIAQLVNDMYPQCRVTIAQKDAGDTRDYNVSFNKLNEELNYKRQWPLVKGISELKEGYDLVSLDQEIFDSRHYTRLKQIQYLIEQNEVDHHLRRVK